MDTVTYPHAAVKKELSNWVLFRADIEKHRKVAELFEVTGIPVAVAVTADGDERGRISGFVEPANFKMRLNELRLNSASRTSMISDLSNGETELKKAFNRDKGHVRLVLILSPT